MMQLNYKNESSTNVSKHYMWALRLANTKHFCKIGILQFFKTAEFLENIYYEYMCGIQLSDLWLEKSDSETLHCKM